MQYVGFLMARLKFRNVHVLHTKIGIVTINLNGKLDELKLKLDELMDKLDELIVKFDELEY